MNSICDHAKKCDHALRCDNGQPHDCIDMQCGTAPFNCSVFPESKCIPVSVVETVTPVHKPVRVRAFKEDIAAENVLLKMRVHELELAAKRFHEMPTMRRIIWAWKGGKNV